MCAIPTPVPGTATAILTRRLLYAGDIIEVPPPRPKRRTRQPSYDFQLEGEFSSRGLILWGDQQGTTRTADSYAALSGPAGGALSVEPTSLGLEVAAEAPSALPHVSGPAVGGGTLAESIARNISASMAQWVQAHPMADGSGGGHDRQMVEAVAAAASAAAAAAASAVIAAAGEAVQAKIQEKAAQGLLPLLVHPFTDLAPLPLPAPGASRAQLQQSLGLVGRQLPSSAAFGLLPQASMQLAASAQQQQDANAALMSLCLDEVWNLGSSPGRADRAVGDGEVPAPAAGSSGRAALGSAAAEALLVPQWATAGHHVVGRPGAADETAAAVAAARVFPAVAGILDLGVARDSGSGSKAGREEDTGTRTGTRGTGNSITEERAVQFVSSALRSCPGGGSLPAAATAAALQKPQHQHHRHRSSSSRLLGGPLGASVASNHMSGRAGGPHHHHGGGGHKSHMTEVPMMSDSDHARIQDFINDGNFQQRSMPPGCGGNGDGGTGSGSAGDSGLQAGDQQGETLVKECQQQLQGDAGSLGKDGLQQQQMQQQPGDGSGTGSGSQQAMPPSSGKSSCFSLGRSLLQDLLPTIAYAAAAAYLLLPHPH